VLRYMNEIDFNNVDFEKKFLKFRKNGLLLSDEQVEVLERYNINYSSCLSNTELLYKIDSVLNEVDDYELECVAQELAERNYYVNTNK